MNLGSFGFIFQFFAAVLTRVSTLRVGASAWRLERSLMRRMVSSTLKRRFGSTSSTFIGRR